MAMNMMRSESSLKIAAPPPSPTQSAPPSPIPRAEGSRSAANQIFSEFLEKTLHVPELAFPEPYNTTTISQEQSALSIYKYHHNNIAIPNEQSPSPRYAHHNHLCNHVLSLHLPFRHCKYWVESRQFPFSFNAGPEVIVVTVGKQLEEWSLGEFKSVLGEMIHPPHLKASCSLELKCSSLNLKQSFSKTQKKISIADQILIGLVIAILYHNFKFLYMVMNE